MQPIAPTLMTLEALRSVPLFASLGDDDARALRDLLRTRAAPAGTRLFRAGDVGDAMYLIERGRVRIHVTDSASQNLTLAELAGGDFFGEMSLLDGQSRSADATVIDDACLAVLSRDEFLRFVRGNTDVALEMLSAVTNRLRHTDDLLRRRVSRNANDEDAARLTFADRLADVIAEFGGSWKFISATIALLVVWVLLNSWLLRAEGRFDNYPFEFLGVVLSVIAGLQAPIIMMSQNRQSEKDRLRADLDYQVNLKNELALGEVLHRLDVLESERLPLLFGEQNARLAESRVGSRESEI
ncbi:MAG: DUF1003 domain-containing protein [Pyrinomonadaceae bacterium]|nr:DUF1003 domain-containing protein [Pyrinomonadaceae bacterium]